MMAEGGRRRRRLEDEDEDEPISAQESSVGLPTKKDLSKISPLTITQNPLFQKTNHQWDVFQ